MAEIKTAEWRKAYYSGQTH